MQNLQWDYIDSGEQTGAYNMALDESLARSLASGSRRPVLRVFRWNPWAISVGHHQGTDELDLVRCAGDGIDVVRRPTGGRAILHAEELTYCVVMPSGRSSVLEVYHDISSALVRGLALYGVVLSLQKSQPNVAEHDRSTSSIPCFISSARYEIEWNGRKLVGSAQRRFHNAGEDVVLQHGSILCGPAHMRLVGYLSAVEPSLPERILRLMRERTVDLSEITGETIDLLRLADCLRRGFEESWGITLTTVGVEEIHAQKA